MGLADIFTQFLNFLLQIPQLFIDFIEQWAQALNQI